MRILIVGGGVAGLTLAALLRQRDFEPTVVEKADTYGEAGYALSLWPLGGRILRGLGLTGRFREESVPLDRYAVHDASGRLLKSFRVSEWMKRHGETRTITRADLLELLLSYSGGLPVKTGTTVEQLDQDDEVVRAHLSDGSQADYDLVIGADGIHSETRRLLFAETPLKDYGFRVWVWWSHHGSTSPEEVDEYWGEKGKLFGIYPTIDRVACAAVLPTQAGRPDTLKERRAFLRRHFSGFGGTPVREALDWLEEAEEVHAWDLEDTRLDRWHEGRVVLIGDAAAPFLPTAGVGASMAMESAAVLADELSRTTARYVPEAIDLYVKRRRDRVDAVQAESRRILKIMGLESHLLTNARNLAMRFTTENLMFRNISKRMGQPI